MYKIDDEFRPPGRLFVKATRETTTNGSNDGTVDIPVRKSNLKTVSSSRGPAITTNLDDRAIQFEHEVKHEKTIEAMITEYPPSNYQHHYHQPPHHSNNLPQIMNTRDASTSKEMVVHTNNGHNNALTKYSPYDNDPNVDKIVRNKRLATEVLGSSMETTQLSQKAPDGQHRRITTQMVRKITTLSRAEESAYPERPNVVTRETSEIAYQSITDGGGPKKAKVMLYDIFGVVTLS